MRYICQAVVIGLLIGSQSVLAMQGRALFKSSSQLTGAMQIDQSSSNALDIHPYMDADNLTADVQALSLYSPSIESTVKGVVGKLGLSLQEMKSRKGTTRVGRMQHAAGRLCAQYGDMVIADGYVRSSFRPTKSNLEQSYLNVSSSQPLASSEALDELYAVVPDAKDVSVMDPCLSLLGGELVWTTEVKFVDSKLEIPMLARVRPGHALEVVDQSFSVDAQIEAYVSNPSDGATDVYNYSDLNAGSTFLDSPFFRTSVETGDRASSDDRDYTGFAPESQEFEEANAFVHVREALDFYTNAGFEWYGPSPMTVRVRDTFGEGIPQDNALFIPGEAAVSGRPSIRIGEGTGAPFLANLGFDIDVVAHELGHFVLFQTLKNAQAGSETITIHEGGADFLAFALSGDACLGESTCPSGSQVCVETGCLRSGLNSLKINDGTYSQEEEFHLLGQVISGALWDLTDVYSVPRDTVTELFIDAIDLLIFDSGYRDLFLALLTADRNNFGGQYAEEICAVSSARGFDSYLEDVNCPNPTTIPPIAGLSALPDSRLFGDSQSTSGCGVVGTSSGQGKVPVALLLLAIVPLLLWPRKEQIKAL